ncbi:MAG TPA: M28 family peptidase [Terriglobales bacterium]
MSASKIVAVCGVLMLTGALMVAQQKSVRTAAKPDPKIVAAMAKVSAAQLRENDEKLVSFGTRHTLSVQLPADSTGGIKKAAEWIKQQFESYSKACGGCLEVKTQTEMQEKSNRIPEPIEITNVYAVLKGTDPESAKRIYVISGHYDSRNSETNDYTNPSPGANDDASGTITVLETARVLSQYKFPATLIFLAVAGEEQGLYGSKQFAKMAKENGWNIEGDLNNDIVGGDKSPGQDATKVRVFSEGIPANATPEMARRIRGLGEENDSPSRQLARYIDEIGRQYSAGPGFHPVMIFRPDRYLRGGDHLSFNEQGFAAVRFTEWHENYDHQHQTLRTENGIEYGDLPKFVDFGYVAKVARLEIAALASLASAPAPPANVKMLTQKLDNDTQLAWDASPGGRVAYYEVVWRSTILPNWTDGKRVGTATSVTLPVSKDNVVFGVRAVDAEGHKSLVVPPTPAR